MLSQYAIALHRKKGSLAAGIAVGLGMSFLLGTIAMVGQTAATIKFQQLQQTINSMESYYTTELLAWHSHQVKAKLYGACNPGCGKDLCRVDMANDYLPVGTPNGALTSLPAKGSLTGSGSTIWDTAPKDMSHTEIRHRYDHLCVRQPASVSSEKSCGLIHLPGSKRSFKTCIAEGKAPPCNGGSLDLTFGNEGKLRFAFDFPQNVGQRVIKLSLQSDGSIVALGDFGPWDCDKDSGCRFFIARYLANGSLDSSFVDTTVIPPTFGYHIGWTGKGTDRARALVLQLDGKILIAGKNRAGGLDNSFVARVTGQAEFDRSFGVRGFAFPAISRGNDGLEALAIQTDGKILSAGFTSNGGGGTDFVLVRLHPNGSLDGSFGQGGIVKTNVDILDHANDILILPDDNILVAGYTSGSPSKRLALLRYLPNGDLDTSFNGTGIITTDIPGTSAQIHSIARQRDGNIVVAGIAESAIGAQFVVARYLPKGELDGSFGTAGVVLLPGAAPGEKNGSPFTTITIDEKQSILIGGTGENQNQTVLTVHRVLSTGILDSTFGSGGRSEIAFGSLNAMGYGLAFQNDGRLIIGGGVLTEAQKSQNVLARIETCSRPQNKCSSGSLITFETIPNPGGPALVPFEGMVIQDQFWETHGVRFRVLDKLTERVIDKLPVIAEVGPPRRAFLCDNCATVPARGGSMDLLDTLKDPDALAAGRFILTDDGETRKVAGVMRVEYKNPVSTASGVIIDVDGNDGVNGGERWTLDASNATGTVVVTTVLDAKGTLRKNGRMWGWSFIRPTADISSIRFTGFKLNGNFGLAFDLFSPEGDCNLEPR